MFDDDTTPKPFSFVIGQPLDTMSVEEIQDTIESLRSEIVRLEDAMKSKAQHLSAADALFTKK